MVGKILFLGGRMDWQAVCDWHWPNVYGYESCAHYWQFGSSWCVPEGSSGKRRTQCINNVFAEPTIVWSSSYFLGKISDYQNSFYLLLELCLFQDVRTLNKTLYIFRFLIPIWSFFDIQYQNNQKLIFLFWAIHGNTFKLHDVFFNFLLIFTGIHLNCCWINFTFKLICFKWHLLYEFEIVSR